MSPRNLRYPPFLLLILVSLALGILTACTSRADVAPAWPSPTSAEATRPHSSAPPSIVTASVTAAATPRPTRTETGPPSTPSPSPTITPAPTETFTPTTSPTPTPDTRPRPETWSSWPTIPTVSAKVREIYLAGQQLGNNTHAFSRIGDCQSVPAVFMGLYDTPGRYTLGNYQDLQQTIDQFAGSFARDSVTAKDGFGVSSVFSPLMADPTLCSSNETPLECEFRIQRPTVVFIAMGTNWAPGASASFEKYLRQIVDFSVTHGAIPILLTKADNIEGDYLLNKSIARVAYDYDVPLVNAWLAVQYLPNKGLEADGIYLTTAAWDERAFVALRTLDAVWNAVKELDVPAEKGAPNGAPFSPAGFN